VVATGAVVVVGRGAAVVAVGAASVAVACGATVLVGAVVAVACGAVVAVGGNTGVLVAVCVPQATSKKVGGKIIAARKKRLRLGKLFFVIFSFSVLYQSHRLFLLASRCEDFAKVNLLILFKHYRDSLSKMDLRSFN
jgi:hypothetical protein